MRLLLIRHAPTPETGKRLTGRLPGVALSAEGVEMAERLASHLEGVTPAALYTSPVLRCRETARIVGATWGLSPVAYRSFIEVDYGTWAGRSLGSLRRTKQWRQLFIAPSRVRFPGGETISEVQARAVAACEQLGTSHGDATVAVVSHADVIRTVLAHYLGMALDLYQRIHVGPASLSIIELPSSGFPTVPIVNWPLGTGGIS